MNKEIFAHYKYEGGFKEEIVIFYDKDNDRYNLQEKTEKTIFYSDFIDEKLSRIIQSLIYEIKKPVD
tara:strand:- start:303 stop:503 length:201 start_codon:yes stop_codon:yes gene_type:complete